MDMLRFADGITINADEKKDLEKLMKTIDNN